MARIRSGYSFSAATGHLPEVFAKVQELGWGCAPITDRMSTFGFNRFTKLAKKAGIPVAYGIEIPCVPELGLKKPPVDHWTFFAHTSLRPLNDLIYQATDNPGKEPSLLYSQALAAVAQGGLSVVAGERCLLDRLPALDDHDFSLALSPSTSKGLVRRALERGIPLVASSDNYYTNEADLEFYRLTLGWRGGTQTYPRHIMTDTEWRSWFESLGVASSILEAAIANRHTLLNKCHATMRKAKLLSPGSEKTLRQLCEEGAPSRNINLDDPVYRERLERELGVIEEKNFADYFFILADLLSFARTKMVVGPARGSSAGSLVCYLTGITAIDPIPYGLIFERFLDQNRVDPPDIDSDFSDTKRHLVFEYAEKKYGRERCARLGTVGMFKARSALNQAGKVLGVPSWRTDKLADSIIERSSGDSRLMNSLEDTLTQTDAGKALLKEHPEIAMAARMEGHPSVSSQHAAGLLLTDEPIAEFVAMNARTRAAWCDKKDSEDLNLLKVDALGLTQLSIFERTLELIGEVPESSFFDRIPLADPVAFEVLNKGQFSGIFQFTGTALRALANQIKFEKLDDLVAMTALARPGPLASGGAMAWIKRRNGEPVPTDMHPLLRELTKDTYGVVMYQESVMRITRELGNFSWADTAAIRKLMSNRSGNEAFNRFEEQFLAGAQANGMELETAKEVWGQIDTMGSWAFNLSHAVAYGIVSYWCCWLKGHYPTAFAAATLDAEADAGKQLAILRELDAEGTGYVPVDPEHSIDRWSIAPHPETGKPRLIGPLTAIKGIGPAKVREILDTHKSGNPLRPAILKQLNNAKTSIDSLTPIKDRVHALHPDLSKINIFSEPTPVKQVQPGFRGDALIFAVATKISTRDENEAINVAKRDGRRLTGPTQSINLFFRDDTDEMFCKIDRFNFDRLSPIVLEKGRAGRSLFAIKGQVPGDFRMIKIKNIRYLGDLD